MVSVDANDEMCLKVMWCI